MGIQPSVAVVHSLGKMAAAPAASVFSLEDGMRFVARRGAVLTALPGAGAMAVVFASKPWVAALLREANVASNGLGLRIAADNRAHQVVSGPLAAVEAVVKRFELEEARVRRLNTSQAFHSAVV